MKKLAITAAIFALSMIGTTDQDSTATSYSKFTMPKKTYWSESASENMDRLGLIKGIYDCTIGKDIALRKIAISVAAWESAWGRSKLSREYNNYFGIKEFGSGKKVNMPTLELENERLIKKDQDFCHESSLEDSVNRFFNLGIVKKSYQESGGDAIRTLIRMYEKGYAGKNNDEWLNGVTGVYSTL